MKQINKMTFDLTSEKGIKDLKALIEFLSLNSLNEEYCYNDIHVSYIDGGFAKVEWTDVLKSGEDDCEWVFRNYDQLLVKQIDFPDGSYNFARDDEEETELWNNWKAAHPEWYEEDSIVGKRWVNKMEKYEDYPDDFVQTIKEHPACPFGHVKEPDYDAEWENTKKQMTEEQYNESVKEMEKIADENPTPESIKTMWDTGTKYILENGVEITKENEDSGNEEVPNPDWKPEEDGENPMLDEVFDEDEQEELRKMHRKFDHELE